MDTKRALAQQVLMAARENGISSVLLRNATGRRLGLNITDSECLSLLSIKGVSTPTELARYTGLTTGSTTAMLDRLEQAGFISRKPNLKDRRGVLVETSQRYREKAGPLVVDLQKAHHQLLTSYSEKELEIITDFLSRFTKNVVGQTERVEKGL